MGESLAMDEVTGLGFTAIVLIALLFLVRGLIGGVLKKRADGVATIMAYEAGVKFRKGSLEAVLGPGRYFTWPAPVTITRVDLRQFTATVAGQEMLSADQMPLRVSAIATYRVIDPKAYVTVASSPASQLYEAVQIGLRVRVAAQKLDDLMANRALIDAGLAEELAPTLAGLGLKIESITMRDINLVGASKQAYADLWKAQKEGLAALERARGEQAALRALNNAARMLKGNPELMNLRLLQAVAGGPGKPAATVVLGGGSGLLPLSSNGSNNAEAPPSDE
jgi:regulator of protease activity HflC (stomatin/prohibitin superfamily)